MDRNESTAVFTGKVRSAFLAAEAEGIVFLVTKGYMVAKLMLK